MAKRFTDTEKWRDPWFCSLTIQEKMFWVFLLDTCNLAGIWQVNWPLVDFYIPGFEYKADKFKGRIEVISPEKWFIAKFPVFQYGELQTTNRMHNRIIYELQKEGVLTPLKYPSQGVKDKDKDKDKDMDKESLGDKGIGEKGKKSSSDASKPNPTPEKLAEFWNSEAAPNLPRVDLTLPFSPTRLKHVKGRLKEHPEKEFWLKVIKRVNSSPFLTGRTPAAFRCSFDWMINPTNLTKILEGNYDDRSHHQRVDREVQIQNGKPIMGPVSELLGGVDKT